MTPDPTEIILTNDAEFLRELLDLVIATRRQVTQLTEIMCDRISDEPIDMYELGRMIDEDMRTANEPRRG